jgi:CheY-like chemotaxis protein
LEALHGFYGVMKRRDGKQGSLFWFAIPYKPDTMFAHHIPTPKEIEMKRKEANPLNVLQEVLTLNKPPEIESPILEETTENIQPSSLHILLVDDSPPILKMSSLMLKKLGHCVVTAENGAIALKRIEESFHPNTSSQNKKFDLLLIDLQMPIMDGLEAISRIRAMEIGNIAVPTITASSSFGTCAEEKLSFRHKIVGMSANSDSETCTEAFQAGADAFLPKPFTVDAFTEVLQEVGVELH